jgi:hypothetical protein
MRKTGADNRIDLFMRASNPTLLQAAGIRDRRQGDRRQGERRRRSVPGTQSDGPQPVTDKLTDEVT